MLLFKLLVAALSLLPLFFSIKGIVKLKLNAAIVYYPVFFVFFPLHLIADVVFGEPYFPSNFSGMVEPYNDVYTNIIYLLFLVGVSLIVMFFQAKKPWDLTGLHFKSSRAVRWFLWLLAALGPASLLMSDNPLIYLNYGSIRMAGEEIYSGHGVIWMATFLSAVSVLFLKVLGEGRSWLRGGGLFLILCIDIYLNSKRMIFVFPIFYFLVDYVFFGRRKTSVILILLASVFFIWAYGSYQKFEYEVSAERSYFMFRVEFGRDLIMKYVIYNALLQQNDILAYVGESLLFNVYAYVPRVFMEGMLGIDKGYPYAQYLSGHLLTGYQGPGLLGWSMTTSIFDELISNFRWFGFAVAWAFLIYFFRIVDREARLGLKVLYLSLMVLLTFLHTAPYLFLLYFFIFTRVFYFLKRVRIGGRV